jgi:hypothetical protein
MTMTLSGHHAAWQRSSRSPVPYHPRGVADGVADGVRRRDSEAARLAIDWTVKTPSRVVLQMQTGAELGIPSRRDWIHP